MGRSITAFTLFFNPDGSIVKKNQLKKSVVDFWSTGGLIVNKKWQIPAKWGNTKNEPTLGKRIEDITPRAMDILTAYSWPGNVRELQNLMERMVILCKNPNIDVGDLPSYLSGDIGDSRFVSETLGILPAGVSLENYVKQFEFRVLLQTLKK